jgi:stage V sporulation protein B
MGLIDSMMVPGLLRSSGLSYQVATKLYGQMTGKAFVLINVPLTLSMALSQSTVPAISDAYAVRDYRKLERNIKTAVKMAIILALPCCTGLYVLSRPILSMIFQGMSDGWELMQILSAGAVFIIIAQVCTSILNGMGRTIMPVVILAAGCIVKIAVNVAFIPVPQLSIKAAAYATVAAYVVVALLDILLVVKYTKIRLDFAGMFAGPLACTIVMSVIVIVVYSNIYNLWYNNTAATVIAITAGGLAYLAMLMVTRTMDYKELKKYLY